MSIFRLECFTYVLFLLWVKALFLLPATNLLTLTTCLGIWQMTSPNGPGLSVGCARIVADEGGSSLTIPTR